MTKIKSRCVLITGGASGIGRIMGRMSLERGASQLVIWDINEKGIADTVAEFSMLGNVKGYKVDKVTITDEEDNKVKYTTNDRINFKFTMPATNVIIKKLTKKQKITTILYQKLVFLLKINVLLN